MSETIKYWTNLGTILTIGIALFVAVLNMHSSLNAQMSDLRGEMVSMRGEMADMRERLARIETRLDHLEGRVDRIENHLGIVAAADTGAETPAVTPARERTGEAIGAARPSARNAAAAHSPQARSRSRNSRIVLLLARHAENIRSILAPGSLPRFAAGNQGLHCVA